MPCLAGPAGTCAVMSLATSGRELEFSGDRSDARMPFTVLTKASRPISRQCSRGCSGWVRARCVSSFPRPQERGARARSRMPRELVAMATYKNFEDMLQRQPGPVLVDFYATWCGPCQMMSEILTQVGPQMKDELKIVKIDSDKYPSLAAKFAVAGLPTLILFNEGKEYQRIQGVLPGDELMTQLRYWLSETGEGVGPVVSPSGDACNPPKDACAPPPRDACTPPPAACPPPPPAAASSPRDACAPPDPVQE